MPNPELIELLPKGFRDVYWCWILNEPVIISYKDDKPFCHNCDGEMIEEEHTFLFHIFKPRKR